MTPVRSAKNQYNGINAHLHSHWQNAGGWDEFHTSHIVYLAAALRLQLLPMGYTAGIEQSLQIRRADEPAGKPKSDVTIYDKDMTRAQRPAVSTFASAPLVAPIHEMIEDIEEVIEYRALAIYESGTNRGQPVAWIELLSPSNKPGGQDDFYYRSKRLKLLRSGIVFIELDYLHESPPTFRRIAPYDSPDGSAYRIIVVDPRPSFSEGQVYLHSIRVDEPLPQVDIPLSAGDVLAFDFGAPYQRTVEESLYTLELVDYRQLPAGFNRYAPDDQARILSRMLAVIEAANQRVDLEKAGLLPIEPLPLAEARRRYEAVNPT